MPRPARFDPTIGAFRPSSVSLSHVYQRPRVGAMVGRELTQLSDSGVVAHIQALRDQPTVTIRRWNYGRDERYRCWTVLRHPASDTGIAYCEHGFGPRSPWGLVLLQGDERLTSLEWIALGIRRSCKLSLNRMRQQTCQSGTSSKWTARLGTCKMQALSSEGDWDATWARLTALQAADPANQYDMIAGRPSSSLARPTSS